jgi:hypothetical protein
VTRKIVISERAEFNEHYFPALKQKVELPILCVVGPPPLDPVLDSELDEVIDLGGGLEPKHSKPDQPRVQEVPDEDDPNGGNDDDDADEPPPPPPNPSPSPSPPSSTHSPSPPPQPPPRKRQKITHVAPTLASNRPKHNIKQPRARWILPPSTEQQGLEPVVAQQGEGNADDNAEADMQEDGMLVVEFAGVVFQNEPQSLKDAMKRSDAAEWYEAAAAEMNNHECHGTWSLVKAPKGINLVDGRWVSK